MIPQEILDAASAAMREPVSKAGFDPNEPRDPHTGQWIRLGVGGVTSALVRSVKPDESGLIDTPQEEEAATDLILGAIRRKRPPTTGAVASAMSRDVRVQSYEYAQTQMEPVLEDLRDYASEYPDVLQEGRDWYPDAKKFAADLARNAGPQGMTTSQAAGIIAILSQQAAWSSNKERAENAIRVAGNGPLLHTAEELKAMKKPSGERTYDDEEVRVLTTRNGTDADIMAAANIPAGALPDLPGKVLHVMKGGEIINERGLHGIKVEQFYAAIMGDTEAVAMDAWMHRAAGLSTPIFKPGRSVNKMVREGELIPYEGEGGEEVKYKNKNGDTVTGKLITPSGVIVGGPADPFDPSIKAKHIHWDDDPLTTDVQRPYAKAAITAVARQHHEDPRVTQAIIWLVLQRALGIERANAAQAVKGQKVEHKRERRFTRHNRLRPSFQIVPDPEHPGEWIHKAGFDPHQKRDPHTGEWIKVAVGAVASALPRSDLDAAGRAAGQIEARGAPPATLLNLAPINVEQIHQHPGRRGEPVDRHLGSLITPDRQGTPGRGHTLEELAASGVPWAADNGAFVALDKPEFVRMIDRIAALPEDQKPMWVAVPDKVGDSEVTRARFDEWKGEFKRRGIKMAYVVQNGQRAEDIPWDDIEAVFIGGTWQDDNGRRYKGSIYRRKDGSVYGSADDDIITGKSPSNLPPKRKKGDPPVDLSKYDHELTPTERKKEGIYDWKLSPEAKQIAIEAKRHGKLVHWGRVNTPERIHEIMSQGEERGGRRAISGSVADTFDGTNFGAGRRLPVGTHTRSEARQPLGPSRMRRSLDWITVEEHRRREAARELERKRKARAAELRAAFGGRVR